MIAERYVLLDRLGDGGMATVHRARQRGVGGFDRIVAIKQIAPNLAENPEYVERFIHEARIASAFSHPSIVQVYDFGRDGDSFYIAMEHVEGRSLLALARDAAEAGIPVPVEVVVAILTEVADALDHVHTRTGLDGQRLDIIHRDVSLANVLVTHSGHVKLIDFGVATGRGFPNPWRNRAVGKPSYMAPETIRARAVDARADLYSLGVIGWELLAGYPLFFADDIAATFRNVLEGEVLPLGQVREDCPPEVETVIHSAIERDRTRRPPTALVLRARLEAAARSAELGTGPTVIWRWLQTLPPASPEPTIDFSTFNLPRLVVPAPTPAPPAPLPIAPRRRTSPLRIALVAAITIAVGVLAIGFDRGSTSASASTTTPVESSAAAAPFLTPIGGRPGDVTVRAGETNIDSTSTAAAESSGADSSTAKTTSAESPTAKSGVDSLPATKAARADSSHGTDSSTAMTDGTDRTAVKSSGAAPVPSAKRVRDDSTAAKSSADSLPTAKSKAAELPATKISRGEPPAAKTTAADPRSTASRPAGDRVASSRAHIPPASRDDANHPTKFTAFDNLPTDSPTLPQPIIAPQPEPLPRRAGPVVIRPDRVTKLAGEVSLPHTVTEHLPVLTAVICIDEHGAVKSSRLLGDMPPAARDSVMRDLRGFRFSPYLEGGVAAPACFTRQLSVGTHR